MSLNLRTDALSRLIEIALLLNHDMTRSLAKDDLTTARAPVLWDIAHRGPVTQRDLADAMHVTARNMTGLIDGLVASGFVTREPHPSDRRATLVTLTEKGSTIVQKLTREQHEAADVLFSGMSRSDLATFVSGLDHVVTKLNEHGLDLAATHEDEA